MAKKDNTTGMLGKQMTLGHQEQPTCAIILPGNKVRFAHAVAI